MLVSLHLWKNGCIAVVAAAGVHLGIVGQQKGMDVESRQNERTNVGDLSTSLPSTHTADPKSISATTVSNSREIAKFRPPHEW
jgi:hypothetical protein